MKQTILLLSATPYSIKEDDGRINEGISLRYLTNPSLTPIDNGNGSFGTYPAKGTLPLDQKFTIQAAPAIYDAEFEIRVGSDGKAKLDVKTLDFISICEFKIPKK